MPKLPSWYIVYQILREENRVMTEQEIYEKARAIDPMISISDVEKALMKLELNGKIRVYEGSKKGILNVELAEGMSFLTPDEE